MFKIISILTFAWMVFTACNRKSQPVITDRERPAPPIEKDLAGIRPDTTRGKMLYNNRCGKCHGLPDPVQYTTTRWKGILSYMIPRAGLDKEQGLHVSAWVTAHASK